MKFYSALSALSVLSASLMLTANALKGSATFFAPGLGACGRTNQASDLIVALPTAQFGTGEHCFKNVGIHYQGKLVKAMVVDKCPGCGSNDLDLSPTAFSLLADLAVGRMTVDWEFL